MKRILLKSSPLLVAIALAGCEAQGLYTTAGEQDASSKAFGGANANNVVAQSAYLKGGVLADLSNSFRAAAPDMINFAFNSTQLDAEARATLDRQAAWISANPAIHFRVYGHTDKVGSNAYNQRLGLRRAQAAVNYLVSRGVQRSKLEAVSSFGETRPLVNTENRERLNRRTVTEVIGFARGYVGSDLDGKYANGYYLGYVAGDL
ncbi:OmpA family protein [Algicella marina]|uniref:OmpA family protein n=1 Tax=Algicella marina TaxID=2683284 RepID=A0A6P1T5Z2_9RHOB|nr:OmpA family protein [Algicella marina]QHQ37231.1 OmpA family protein [Algicella marina]